MAITVHSNATAGAAAGTSVVVTPGAISNNDILLDLIYKENTNAVTYPSGFTQYTAQAASDSGHVAYSAWKRAASESGTYTSSWTGSVWRDGLIIAISGCITSGDPADVTPVSQANGVVDKPVAPSITTVTDNSMVIVFFTNFAGGLSSTPPTGFTLIVNFDDCAVFYKIQTPAGATGSTTATVGANGGQSTGTAIALKIASAAVIRPKVIRINQAVNRAATF